MNVANRDTDSTLTRDQSAFVNKRGTSCGEGSNNATASYRDHAAQGMRENGIPSMKASPTFPMKLHEILSNKEFEHIITWLPHGRAWRIINQKDFEEQVIPAYFRHERFSSFARQVNGWAFRRIVHGIDYNGYYHEKFIYGLPRLCESMKRLTAKDMAERKGADVSDAAPNFFAFSCLRSRPLSGNMPPARATPAHLRAHTASSTMNNQERHIEPAALAHSRQDTYHSEALRGRHALPGGTYQDFSTQLSNPPQGASNPFTSVQPSISSQIEGLLQSLLRGGSSSIIPPRAVTASILLQHQTNSDDPLGRLLRNQRTIPPNFQTQLPLQSFLNRQQHSNVNQNISDLLMQLQQTQGQLQRIHGQVTSTNSNNETANHQQQTVHQPQPGNSGDVHAMMALLQQLQNRDMDQVPLDVKISQKQQQQSQQDQQQQPQPSSLASFQIMQLLQQHQQYQQQLERQVQVPTPIRQQQPQQGNTTTEEDYNLVRLRAAAAAANQWR